MQSIQTAHKVAWPDGDINDNFSFSTVHPDGVFSFTFRYFNGHWNCWCTLPDGEVRPAGVYPGVPSWTEYTDYGLIFGTQLSEIGRDSLYMTSLYILTWEK